MMVSGERKKGLLAKLHALISVWSGLMLVGLVMTIGGCSHTLGFLKNVQHYKALTARQIVVQLIVPHMIMLAGMGILVAGFILVVRRGVIASRLKHNAV